MVAAAARRSADAVVAIGKQLMSIRDRLPHGQWVQWVDDNASFGRSTARNYIELARWSQREPAQFARLRHLGPGKLYVLAGVDARRVRALRPGKVVAVPGSEARKTIEVMTTLELGAVVGDLVAPGDAGDDEDKVPIGQVVQGVRAKLSALGVAADSMLERAGEVDKRVMREIRGDVLEVLRRIDGALA